MLLRWGYGRERLKKTPPPFQERNLKDSAFPDEVELKRLREELLSCSRVLVSGNTSEAELVGGLHGSGYPRGNARGDQRWQSSRSCQESSLHLPLHRRARAHQIAISIRRIDPADGGPELGFA